MQDTIRFKIKTLSNLFIGGAPVPFVIGGIDQQTAMDRYDFPCIPASSLKGALRTIVHNDSSDMGKDISRLYAEYLKKDRENNWERITKLLENQSDREEALERIRDRYKKADEKLSPEYLFGIEGFNNTPRLLFSDLTLCREYRDNKRCFSIDMKNSIKTTENNTIESNPRSYKTARSGLVFEGEIQLYKIELLGENAKELCTRYIIHNLRQFNNGIYRLGNSKSRGYGKIEVII